MTRYLKAAVSLWPALAPVAVLLAVSLPLFPSSGRDDAYITYWAAHALSNLGEIVNLNGERIEQSSSLLHVLVLAAASKACGLSVPTVGNVVSILSAALTLVYCYRLASLFVGRKLALAAGVIVATSAPFAYWTTGGLEAPLAALVNTALMYHYIKYLEGADLGRAPVSAWIITPLVVLVRPESVFVIGAVILGSYLFFLIRTTYAPGSQLDYQVSVRVKLLQLALVLGVTALVVFLFRQVYFGALFPQPVTAKLGGVFFERVASGLEYLPSALFPPPLSILPFFAAAGVVDAIRRVVRNASPFAGRLVLVLFLLTWVSSSFPAETGWRERGSQCRSSQLYRCWLSSRCR